jgi:hypothetical protein
MSRIFIYQPIIIIIGLYVKMNDTHIWRAILNLHKTLTRREALYLPEKVAENIKSVGLDIDIFETRFVV